MFRDYVVMQKREWLNPYNSEDLGMFKIEVGYDSHSVEGSLTIWDCSRQISLNFDIYNGSEKEAIERAKKLDLLIESLQEMKQAMGKAYSSMLQLQQDDDEPALVRRRAFVWEDEDE